MILANIKRLCAENHISIAELEKRVGLGNGVIARWGKGSPRLDLAKKVADYFGVTVDDLLRKEDE